MIILDFNQLMISTLKEHIGNHTNITIEIDTIRHMVLNTIRAKRMLFKQEYGELVIACDDRHYWRKDLFPYYKEKRREQQEKDELDWNSVWRVLAEIRQELADNFPYKVIIVRHAEADDIIATLATEFHDQEKIMIVSSDKDFAQLQKYPNVHRYSPLLKSEVFCEDPKKFLKQHIIRGDKDDGIPNIMSADDSYVKGVRQGTITKKKLELWLELPPEEFCTDAMLRNYRRNEQLIDLCFVPEEIREQTLEQFNSQNKNRSKIFNYFLQHRLRNLIDAVSDF